MRLYHFRIAHTQSFKPQNVCAAYREPNVPVFVKLTGPNGLVIVRSLDRLRLNAPKLADSVSLNMAAKAKDSGVIAITAASGEFDFGQETTKEAVEAFIYMCCTGIVGYAAQLPTNGDNAGMHLVRLIELCALYLVDPQGKEGSHPRYTPLYYLIMQSVCNYFKSIVDLDHQMRPFCPILIAGDNVRLKAHVISKWMEGCFRAGVSEASAFVAAGSVDVPSEPPMPAYARSPSRDSAPARR